MAERDSSVFIWYTVIHFCRNISSTWNYLCACSSVLFVILFWAVFLLDLLKFLTAEIFLYLKIVSANKVLFVCSLFQSVVFLFFCRNSYDRKRLNFLSVLYWNSSLQKHFFILNLFLQIKFIFFCYIWYLPSKLFSLLY